MERINPYKVLQGFGINIPPGSALERTTTFIDEGDTAMVETNFYDDDDVVEYDADGNPVEVELFTPPHPQPTHPSAKEETHLDDMYREQEAHEDMIRKEKAPMSPECGPPALLTMKWVDPHGIEMFYAIRDTDDAAVMARAKQIKTVIVKSLETYRAQQATPGDVQLPLQPAPTSTPPTTPAVFYDGGKVTPDSPEFATCAVHNVEMKRRARKDGSGLFYSHMVSGTKDWCYGKAK